MFVWPQRRGGLASFPKNTPKVKKHPPRLQIVPRTDTQNEKNRGWFFETRYS
jgi:hypothetical protein